MQTIETNQSLGEIVAAVPKASEIFKKHHIDFCCGGNRPLNQALSEQNLNEREIMNELNAALDDVRSLKDQKDFRNMKPTVLTEYIEGTHHVFLRSILPEISDAVTKVIRAHGANHKELFTVHKLFHELKADLELHLIKEEEILFPLIKDYDKMPSQNKLDHIRNVMGEIEGEHDAAGKILKELRRLTREYQLPDDACQTFMKTYAKLVELESDLFQHIHLENNILFKRLNIQPDRIKM